MANNPKKYAGDSTLSALVAKIKELFVKKTDLNTELAKKADTSHTHDDRYYTETEMDTKLSAKADSSHSHNDIYYTKTEIDNYELVTVDDIDTICGGEIASAANLTF